MKSIVRIAMLVALALGVVSCSDEDEMPATVVEAARAAGDFNTLLAALEATGLDETLEGAGPFTVLAPTDAAFALLPAGLVDLGVIPAPAPAMGGAGAPQAALTEPQIIQVLQYHVLNEALTAEEVTGGDTITPLVGGPISVQVLEDGTVVLDGRVQIETTNIETGNGIVHIIDAVLLPEDLQSTLNVVEILSASPRFSTLVGAVGGEGLALTLSGTNEGNGFTVFAPTNEAFDRLPGMLVADLAMAGSLDDVLLYHVIGSEIDSQAAIAAAGSSVPTASPDGEGNFLLAVDVDGDGDLFLDGRTQVIATDIEASNGIIHVIDSVLVPGVDFPGTVVEALAAYPRFDSLVDAVLDEDLAGAVTDVTVFAPTNDAFAAVTDLGGNTLADVLAYHLLGDVLDSGSLGATETTLQGSDISIGVNGGVVINGSSNVIFADIGATDGIIHVIDEVLVPPAPGS